jgi:hypothetical protein
VLPTTEVLPRAYPYGVAESATPEAGSAMPENGILGII